MAKTVSLNELTYSKLAALSGELTIMSEKPISLGLTVHIALITFETLIENREKRKRLEEKLKHLRISSAEDFDKGMDALYKLITKPES